VPAPATYHRTDAIATITLDDGKVNVMSLAMQEAIHVGLDRAEADGVPVVVRGRDGVFSAGFDLNVLRGGGTDGLAMVKGGFELAARLLAFPLPVVMACTGHAIAMGTFLLFSGDYRIGVSGPYKLTANEVAIGLTMPHAAIAILGHRLTPAALPRAILLAEPFSPADAVAVGYLDKVVDAADLVAEARQVAVASAGLDLTAHAATKARFRAPVLDAVRAGIVADEAELVGQAS
jgi:enoyl-CoA hydratase